MKRIYSIDFVRGIAMIIMALDHVRDLLHTTSITQSPTDLQTTTPPLFFTRWITYLCAPIFVFLAGTSSYLASVKRRDVHQSRAFLFKRGLFLFVLEFTVVNFGMFGDAAFHLLLFEVIAAIGVGFMVLAALVSFSARTVLIIGAAILLTHDAIAFIPMKTGSLVQTALGPLFGPAAFPLGGNHVFVMGYPPIPWLGILLLGYGCGPMFLRPAATRKKRFVGIGIAAIALFVLLRWINVYGDPAPWSTQKTGLYTFLSFINVSKYPPSLQFSLITLGVMFLLLAWGEGATGRLKDIPFAYGKAPLFYFVVHFYLIHVLLIITMYLQGFHWADLHFADGSFGRPKGQLSGIPLWAVYLVWLGVVAAMYQPCRWFYQYRVRHRTGLLKYV